MILDPGLEAKIPSRKLDYPGQLQRITRRLRSMSQTARVRIAREQTLRIGTLTREAEILKRELRDLIREQRPELLEETGCGPLTAAILIGQTAGAERFKSDAHFARLAGVAPVPVSSGRHDRHRLDRGGNRQINPGSAHHRDHPRTPGPLRPALTCSARKPSGQDPHGGDALPQAPSGAPLSPAPVPATRLHSPRSEICLRREGLSRA